MTLGADTVVRLFVCLSLSLSLFSDASYLRRLLRCRVDRDRSLPVDHVGLQSSHDHQCHLPDHLRPSHLDRGSTMERPAEALQIPDTLPGPRTLLYFCWRLSPHNHITNTHTQRTGRDGTGQDRTGRCDADGGIDEMDVDSSRLNSIGTEPVRGDDTTPRQHRHTHSTHT